MTAPVQEPSSQRTLSGLGWGERQLARRPAPPAPSGAGLSFAYAEVTNSGVGGLLNSFRVADLNGADFYSNDYTTFSGVYHDAGKTPEYGLRVPANKLVKVYSWIWITANTADGKHTISWMIDGSYSVSHFGPADSSDFTSSASSVTGLADNKTAPEALYHVAHMGDTAEFTVGVYHGWTGWTNDPNDFKYGISVTVLGDLPT